MGGFHFTLDKRYMDQASVVIFYMQSLPENSDIFRTRRKKKGQLWVFWSKESDVRHRWQYEPDIFNLFDITATYRLDADVPMPYFYPDYFGLLRKEPIEKTGFVNAFVSGTFDQSDRLNYLKELMSYLEVHSYGKMLNNRCLMNDEGALTKRRIIAGYKFSLAFENAISKDYVTEMLFDPLIEGSVPVYLGAPNIDDIVPGDNCYINVSSYSSIKALADYLVELDNDDSRYMEYLKWKVRPYRLEFNLKANIVAKHPLIRLCNVIRTKMSQLEPITYGGN